MIENSKNNKRIAKNTLLLYFRMMLTMVISLYTSRIILNALGVEDFGIYNVVGGVVTMFVFLSGAMASATQRFLAFEIGKKDFDNLKKTFNATLIIHIFIALFIFVIIETAGLWFLINYLKIPENRIDAAKWVFHFSALSFLVSVIRVPYNASIIAHEKMSIYAYLSIIEVSLKLVIVFMLSLINYDKLKLYGILVLSVNILIATSYIIYTKKNFSETKFGFVRDRKLYKTLISYSGWNLFGNFALVAKGQAISILLNIFFGPILNAAQGISNQVNAAVQSFYSNFQTAINPQIIKSYSSNHREYMLFLMIKSARFSFYLLLIISLPIILEVNTVLRIWLKTVPEYADTFTVLILIIVLIDCISGPLMTGIQATGKIRKFQIIVGTLQIMIFPLSYLFFKLGYAPPATYAVSIFVSLISLIIRLKIIKSLIEEFSIKLFFQEVILKNVVIVGLALVLPLGLKYFFNENLLRFCIILFTSAISTITAIYFLGLEYKEKDVLIAGIKSFFIKIKSYI